MNLSKIYYLHIWFVFWNCSRKARTMFNLRIALLKCRPLHNCYIYIQVVINLITTNFTIFSPVPIAFWRIRKLTMVRRGVIRALRELRKSKYIYIDFHIGKVNLHGRFAKDFRFDIQSSPSRAIVCIMTKKMID